MSYVYVIEFQKDGLPHTHLLVTLIHNCKIYITDADNRHIRYDELANSAILSARNFDVEEINKQVVELFDKTEKIHIPFGPSVIKGSRVF